MIYLWPQAGDISDLDNAFGVMTRPSDETVAQGIEEGRWFGVDNGMYSGAFKPIAFFNFLVKLRPYKERCLFVTAPDAMGNAPETIRRYYQYGPTIAAAGWPLAFVAQNGQEYLQIPEGCGWVFIGGVDLGDGRGDWKMEEGARIVIAQARSRGLRVHVGRVNSFSRFQYFRDLGVDSADGTFPTREPTAAKRRLTRALRQRTLFGRFSYGLPDRDRSGK